MCNLLRSENLRAPRFTSSQALFKRPSLLFAVIARRIKLDTAAFINEKMSNPCNHYISCNWFTVFLNYINGYQIHSKWQHEFFMMTTSNGNIFRVTGHLYGKFPAQMLVTRSFDVFFDLRLNNRLSKQSWDWWFETLSRPLWRHCNVTAQLTYFRTHVPCVILRNAYALER